mmetsp:Transcript_34725/g.90867  ORF Transcript_34725/g.90867 Transcript_34725/m.90867 type:complete len:504 (-) Transcript_34725:11-1522(-)
MGGGGGGGGCGWVCRFDEATDTPGAAPYWQPSSRGRLRVRLVLLALLLALALGRLGADLLVVLLEGGEVLAGLGELALLHALADVPVDESALGVHQVELVVDARVELGDGGRVGHHRDGAHDLGEVAARHDGGRLVVDAALEAGRAPVDELDGALGLDGRDRRVDVLGDDVATVHEADRHVLAVARVDLDEHRRRLEGRVGDLGDRELLVVRLLGRDDGRVRRHDEVDARVRHEVGLELGHVDVERAVKAERRRERRDDLRDQAVEVGVRRALNVEVAAADVVEGLVVDHERHVGVLEERVRRQDAIVRLDDRGRDLGRRVEREGQLRLAAVVDREALEEERAQAGAGTAADGVEEQEALEAGAVVGELADAVEDEVDDLLADGVVATRVVVRRVLLARDELLGVVELAVGARADLVDDGRLEVDEHAARDVLARAGLREEGVEGVVAAADRLVRGHLAIGLDAVLEAVELPACVTDLNAGLAKVDGDDFTHILDRACVERVS